MFTTASKLWTNTLVDEKFMRKSLCCKACEHNTCIMHHRSIRRCSISLGSTSKTVFFCLLPNSCSICTKKQNRHFIVPRDDFTLLEVMHLAMLHWKGCGGMREPGGGGGTPYDGLYGEAPPERGTFFRLQVYKRVGISQVEVFKRVGKSVI